MNTTCCRIVTAAAVVGAIGSLIGWYFDGLITALSQSVHDVHFGAALLWMVTSALVVVMFNRLLGKN